MGAALGWGAAAASSLVLGALFGIARTWPRRLIGLVLAFGAGALISAVSFELAAEGIRAGGARPVALGLAVGAVTYFVGYLLIDRGHPQGEREPEEPSARPAPRWPSVHSSMAPPSSSCSGSAWRRAKA
jgi:zinc transporter, ZIP family